MKMRDWNDLDLRERAAAILDLLNGRGSEREWEDWDQVSDVLETLRDFKGSLVSLKDGLDAISYDGEDFNADSFVEVYNGKLWGWAGEGDNIHLVEDAIDEYGWDGSIFRAIQRAQYMVASEELASIACELER